MREDNMSSMDEKLDKYRDADGYYRDGVEVLALMIESVRACNLADDLTLDLPAGAVCVELNGGVPVYLVQGDEGGDFEQATFSEIVDCLEGAHHPEAGVPVNPRLPAEFEGTANEARPASHQMWWGVPFILTDEWEGETWEQYRDRLAGYGSEPDYTPEQWAERQAESKRKWFESFPAGVRYEVRCLDGGAWDRSTWWGNFATLEQAQECARKGPVWTWSKGA